MRRRPSLRDARCISRCHRDALGWLCVTTQAGAGPWAAKRPPRLPCARAIERLGRDHQDLVEIPEHADLGSMMDLLVKHMKQEPEAARVAKLAGD